MNTHHLIDKYELNDIEKQLILYMGKNIHQLKNISVRQMAKDNFTSTTTIYKLCGKLGFEGYSDMIYHLINDHNDENNSADEYIDSKKEFLSLLNQASCLIIYGVGFSSTVAEYMHQRLILKGYQSLCVIHSEMFNQIVDPDTVFIVISQSGKSSILVRYIELAKEKNIPIISFVADKESPIYKQSTLPILIGDYDSFSYELNKKNTFFGESIIAFEHLLFD